MKVICAKCEGGLYYIEEVDLSVRQITRQLNKIQTPSLLLVGSPFNFTFHMIWLPDGREWDTVNGWRYKKRDSRFRGPELFKEKLEDLRIASDN